MTTRPAWSEVRTNTPLQVLPVDAHSARLLAWLHESGLGGQAIRSPDLREIYGSMCLEWWIKPHWWLGQFGVAHAFRLLIRRPKRWLWFVAEDGQRHRYMIYQVPPLAEPTLEQNPERTLEPLPAKPTKTLRDSWRVA